MENLLTAAEVAAMVFGGEDRLPDGVPAEVAVEAAALRHIVPVIGRGMYDAMAAGKYAALAGEYVRPALAAFAAASMVETAAARVDRAGVVRLSGDGFAPAGTGDAARYARRLRADGEALLGEAVRRMSASAADYPEFDPGDDVRLRTRILGGVVL